MEIEIVSTTYRDFMFGFAINNNEQIKRIENSTFTRTYRISIHIAVEKLIGHPRNNVSYKIFRFYYGIRGENLNY